MTVPDYVKQLSWVLDDAIPLGSKRRIGIDGFLSFIPVVGDATGFGLSAIVILAGVQAGCSWPTVARMVLHSAGESVVGTVPVVGPVASVVWKANARNVAIIEAELADGERTRRESWKVLIAAIAIAVVLVCVVIAALAITAVTVARWLSG